MTASYKTFQTDRNKEEKEKFIPLIKVSIKKK